MTLLKKLFIKITILWLIWNNIIVDRFTHKCSIVNWSLVGLRTDSFRSFRVGLPQTVSSFLSDFIVCKSWNPCSKLSTTSTSGSLWYLWDFVLMAQRVLSRAPSHGTWSMRFRTRTAICYDWTRKKKKNKIKPRPHCLGNNCNKICIFEKGTYLIFNCRLSANHYKSACAWARGQGLVQFVFRPRYKSRQITVRCLAV